MPTYSYVCLDCRNTYEKEGTYEELSKFKPECSECHSDNSRKIFFPVGILFKGNGFYKTDSKSEDNVWKN